MRFMSLPTVFRMSSMLVAEKLNPKQGDLVQISGMHESASPGGNRARLVLVSVASWRNPVFY